jgi:hypothetical protein
MEINQKPIGGFFELEKSEIRNNYHSDAIGLSNGRTCLNIILKHVNAKSVYIPYYCCDSLLEAVYENKLKIIFYSINEKFEPTNLPKLKSDELFIYINYFGLKRSYSKYLIEFFGEQVIIDNTHDYFAKGNSVGSSFNSSRKYFGVPDGAYLYTNVDTSGPLLRNINFITDHLVQRLDGRQQEAFESFQKNEMLQNCKPFKISKFSEEILNGINYDLIAEKRRRNYKIYHRELKDLNELNDISIADDTVPFCYPFMRGGMIDLSLFYENNVYIPILWKEVLYRIHEGYHWEKKITRQILPLPIDHRYDEVQLKYVINLIKDIK